MKITSNRLLLYWILITVSFFMVSLILWNTYRFFQKFKEEERVKMENFSAAQIELSKTPIVIFWPQIGENEER